MNAMVAVAHSPPVCVVWAHVSTWVHPHNLETTDFKVFLIKAPHELSFK